MANSADANPELKPVGHPLITHLKTHLDDWNIVEAEREIEQVDYQPWIIEHGLWELTPIILEYLDEEHEEKCPHLVATCGRLLEKLATKCKPKSRTRLCTSSVEGWGVETTKLCIRVGC